MEQIGGIIAIKVRPRTDPSCMTYISTVPPVLTHRKQCPVPFPPTQMFGGERIIRCPPKGMKWRRRGCNFWRLRFSRRPGRGLSTLCDCGGVWVQKQPINFSLVLLVVFFLALVVFLVLVLFFCAAADVRIQVSSLLRRSMYRYFWNLRTHTTHKLHAKFTRYVRNLRVQFTCPIYVHDLCYTF